MAKPKQAQPVLEAFIGLTVWFVFFLVLVAWEATRLDVGSSKYDGVPFAAAVGAAAVAIANPVRKLTALSYYALPGALALAAMTALLVGTFTNAREVFVIPLFHLVGSLVGFGLVALVPWQKAKWSVPVLILAGGWIATAVHVRASEAEAAREVVALVHWLPEEFETAFLPRIVQVEGVDWGEPVTEGDEWTVTGELRGGRGEVELHGWGRWSAGYELRLVTSSSFEMGAREDPSRQGRAQEWLTAQGVGPELVRNLDTWSRLAFSSFFVKGDLVHLMPGGGTLTIRGSVLLDPVSRKFRGPAHNAVS